MQVACLPPVLSPSPTEAAHHKSAKVQTVNAAKSLQLHAAVLAECRNGMRGLRAERQHTLRI
jgi:hypothetical protein